MLSRYECLLHAWTFLLLCVSTKSKSEKSTFYYIFLLLYTGHLLTENQWIEKNSSFHLTYDTVFYSFWFMKYNRIPETTPAPVLSILSWFVLIITNIQYNLLS